MLNAFNFTLTLLHLGADFNPYTLGGQWYLIPVIFHLRTAVPHGTVWSWKNYMIRSQLRSILNDYGVGR